MNTKKFLSLTTALVLLLGFAGVATAETFHIDATHSNAEFQVRHIVSQVKGHFNDFSGTIDYDPKHPEKTKVDATIQIASIDTGNEDRDGHLKSPDFFGVETHPTITFKSKAAKMKDGMLHITGDFTMHGVTKVIVLPVEVLGVGKHPMMNNAPVAGFTAELTLKRSEFGVNNWTDAANVLGDEVKVSLNIEAVAKKSDG